MAGKGYGDNRRGTNLDRMVSETDILKDSCELEARDRVKDWAIIRH